MREALRTRVSWRMAAGAGAILVVAAIGFLGWRLSSSATPESIANEAIAAQGSPPAANAGTTSTTKTLAVYVSGEVAQPGMYRLPAGLRVGDALAAAGGVLADADPNRMPNVAAKLTDGKQIKVPRKGQSGSAAAKVDINSASEAQLDLVRGCRPAWATRSSPSASSTASFPASRISRPSSVSMRPPWRRFAST